MKKIILAAMLSLLSCNLWAGKLDVDYVRPSPTKALMWSMVVPGGGFMYISNHSPHLTYPTLGLAFFFAEIAVVVGAAAYMRNNDAGMALPILAIGGIKVLEFNLTIDAAEKVRHQKSNLPGY